MEALKQACEELCRAGETAPHGETNEMEIIKQLRESEDNIELNERAPTISENMQAYHESLEQQQQVHTEEFARQRALKRMRSRLGSDKFARTSSEGTGESDMSKEERQLRLRGLGITEKRRASKAESGDKRQNGGHRP
ncbi:unnamed protein product [Cylicostephanus goldi]|uniref:Uncharacterized protein n=1 Tax=Cylicostephanus goldi TaxID=71465 RepID=A0A3P7QMQ7_CYLGO|nr:unnamed protein product [Cylicostephanus goldi]